MAIVERRPSWGGKGVIRHLILSSNLTNTKSLPHSIHCHILIFLFISIKRGNLFLEKWLNVGQGMSIKALMVGP